MTRPADFEADNGGAPLPPQDSLRARARIRQAFAATAADGPLGAAGADAPRRVWSSAALAVMEMLGIVADADQGTRRVDGDWRTAQRPFQRAAVWHLVRCPADEGEIVAAALIDAAVAAGAVEPVSSSAGRLTVIGDGPWASFLVNDLLGVDGYLAVGAEADRTCRLWARVGGAIGAAMTQWEEAPAGDPGTQRWRIDAAIAAAQRWVDLEDVFCAVVPDEARAQVGSPGTAEERNLHRRLADTAEAWRTAWAVALDAVAPLDNRTGPLSLSARVFAPTERRRRAEHVALLQAVGHRADKRILAQQGLNAADARPLGRRM